MSRTRRVLRFVSRALLLLLVLLVVVGANIGRITQAMMTPREPFATQTPPPAPDYTRDQSWSALPSRNDLADRAPAGELTSDQQSAPAEVFYLHPTSYVGNHWNAPIDDPALQEATDRVATGIQASAFSGCCAIYAPRYRQANGTAFYRPTADGERALNLAFEDVSRAFADFLRRRGTTRPFFLAAHSQGSVLAERLLYEVLANHPVRDKLVAAYLPGGRITLRRLAERAPAFHPCQTATDLQCIAAWNARGPRYTHNEFELYRPDNNELLCVNPLLWTTSAQHAPRELNLGAVFLETSQQAPRPHFADAQCSQGILLVRSLDTAPRDLPSRILDYVLGPQNYHPIEYQLFFMNLRANARARLEAYTAAHH